ncbi:hypothetical protein LTR36_001421 [Oleoguttula mirabilis]|uniref:DUF7918 domain-containing protein n=1 Tax=Oleoguttula mirabilis TaxID=1507867 RepID=A0AAV9JPV7_9PEZI|nr:hypothetical protein LTR36_001421 [Oleoguttula mirabilis]
MHQNGIRACVYATESKAKKEEFTPLVNSPLYTDDPCVRYIEGLDGERFGVMIDVEKDVLRGDTDATAVEVSFKVDGGLVSQRYVVPFSKHSSARRLRMFDFSAMKHGQWQRHGFAFGKMALDEDLVIALSVLKAISFDDECRLERQAGEALYPSATVDLTQAAASSIGAGKELHERNGRNTDVAITNAFTVRKGHPDRNGAAAQATPRKRPAEDVEVLDMTDGDSPPKRLKSVQVDPVPFSLSKAKSANAPPSAAGQPDKRLEKRRLELQLEEVRIREKRLRIERQMLELEGDDPL